MASLVKEYSKEKLTGQIFTPYFIIEKILDDIGFSSTDILGKNILDPACGDGRFLIKIVERIIKYSPKDKLQENLLMVEGWDIDEIAINTAINRLNELVKDLGLEINWKIKVTNSLLELNSKTNIFNFEENYEYDYIVGNPPYIRIQHLDKIERNFIQKNYNFCKSGSTDIYIAFYELALSLLKTNGICGYITPNTFFHTDTAKGLRKYFELNRNIKQITNYGHIQLFDDATTYSAIVIFDKKKRNDFLFQMAKDKEDFQEKKINFNNIEGSKFWQLSIGNNNNDGGVRLGDISKIHVGITTLADKVYIMPFIKEDNGFIYLKSEYKGIIKIERTILKPIIKASVLKSNDEEIKEYVLFPYRRVNNKNQIIKEDELKERFPFAYNYLLSVKDILDKRDNGKPNSVAWYAFGRSQGLDTSFGKKILFSPMNKEPKFIYSDKEEATFYSGYSIKYDGDIEFLLKELNSSKMGNFIKISSRDFRGGWKAYNKKIVQEFKINLKTNKISLDFQNKR